MWAGLRRRLLLFFGAGALLFLGFSIYADIGGLLDAFGSFAWKMVPIALGLALLNYFLRFLRWHGYLRILEVPLEWNDSLIIFMTGLVLSVTPGKVGEFLKTYLVRRRVGTPVSRSAPAVFMERVTDFISLILLALLGILSEEKSTHLLVFALAGISLLILLLGRPGAVSACLRALNRLPFFRRLNNPLDQILDGIHLLVKPANLTLGLGFGVVAWFAECVGLYAVLLGFGVDIGPIRSASIYSLSTLLGALTMLPGGLGSTEGSMAGLLVLRGVQLPDAVGATLVIRACTLWFAVALGAGVVLRYHGQLDVEPEAATPEAEPRSRIET